MSVFSLQRTNPRITSNIKLVATEDSLYVEAINSTQLLDRSIYKAYEYNSNLSYGTNIKNFAAQFPSKDVLYNIVDESSLNVSNKTYLQYHQKYDFGVYSDSSKLMDANYRFFAPLHINNSTETKLPQAFVIFKVDAKNYKTSKGFNTFADLVDNGKLVKTFDLANLHEIFKSIEDSSIDMQYDQGTVTTGLSLDTGLMVSKQESIIDAMLANETTVTEFENSITNNFREHSLIYSNIVNLEFAFNDEVDDKFVRYFGLYVNYNELAEAEAKEYNDVGAIRLTRKANNQYVKYTNDTVLETYDEIKQSRFSNGFGLTKAPQIKIKIILRPKPGEKLLIKFGNVVEHTVMFDSTTVGNNVNTVAEWLSNELTFNYTGQYSSLTCHVENGNELVLRTVSSSLTGENLSVETPSSISVIAPKYTSTSYANNFIGSGQNTISVNTYFNPNEYNKIQYVDDSGNLRKASITLVTEYAGDYLYRLDEPIINKSESPDNIWFLQTIQEQPILCSVVEHRDLDVSTTESQYSDVLDFDIDKYNSYLTNIINDPEFRGRADEEYDHIHPSIPATVAEVAQYKAKLIESLDKYFDNISLNRQYLYKDVDISTQEATTTLNEYNRLSENSLEDLTNINKLYKFINKWSYRLGTDVYSNDYRMNISLPFRYDGFSPSLESINRDIRYHTHSWPIIGEGQNPYLEVTESEIHKCLSYSRLPLSVDILKSKETDAYRYLEYSTDLADYAAYSKFVWDADSSACFTFFRGLLLRMDDSSLQDYKFSAVLLTQEPVKENVINYEWVRNDKFKTLTLVLKFYIPDPILTSLERGDSFYFLDRSLLYFSEDIYSTSVNTIDFGTDEISLSLYDSTSQKTYLGNVVTRNWFYNDGIQTLLYVSRGNLNRFNTPLDEILNIGQDFTINFTSTDDTNSPNFGMKLTFKNIQEVKTEYFWCTDIEITHITTHDPDGVDDLDPNDNIVDSVEIHNAYQLYASDPEIFETNNPVYISKAIAYENSTYNRIVTAKSNIARYRELSVTNIAEILKSTDIKQINDNNEESYLRATIINPTKTAIAVSLTEENGILERLANNYVFPIVRYSGEYIPQTKTLLVFDSNSKYQNIYAKNPLATKRNRLAVSKDSSNIARTNEYVETYIRDIMPAEFFTYYGQVKDNNLPWIFDPSEYRSFVSIVLNSSEELNITITKTDSTDLRQYLYTEVRKFCPISLFDLTDEVKVNMLNLKYDVSSLTVNNYDVDRELVNNFIESTFLNIYELESIQLSDDTYVNFVVNDSILTILDTIANGTELKLNFKR